MTAFNEWTAVAAAQAEVTRRLGMFDDVFAFAISHDTSASANGYSEVLDSSVEGEWYAKGAADMLEAVRSRMVAYSDEEEE